MLPALSPGDARLHLDALIAGCLQGRLAPLCYAPETSATMLSGLKKSDTSAALADARSAWSKEAGSFGSGGEGLASAAQLAWRDADPFAPPLDAEWLRWAGVVAAPLDAWWNARPATA